MASTALLLFLLVIGSFQRPATATEFQYAESQRGTIYISNTQCLPWESDNNQISIMMSFTEGRDSNAASVCSAARVRRPAQ
jgi:hypothetical protein